MGSFPGLGNQCMFGLAKQQAGSYAPATELDIIRFWNFPFRELVWHLRTQVNNSDLASYISVFDPRRGKLERFIPFLVYVLVYPIIAGNLVTLATLSHWSNSVHTHACCTFLRKPFLG